MELFELLLVLVFFVFPVIQLLLEQRSKGRKPPPPPPAHGEVPQSSPTTQRVELPQGWPTDWGGWPGAEDGEEEAELVDEPEPAIGPVVSLEALHVDHAAERARLLARYGAPRAARGPLRAVPRAHALLAGQGGLRRAVLLAELIGPPRALVGLPAER